MTPRTPFLAFIVVVLMTGAALLACGQSGNSTALTAPGISTVVITPIGTMNARAQAVAIQSDEKVVAAGSAYNGTQNVFALARYNKADGSLDITLNPCPVTPTAPCDGIVTTPIGAVDDQAQALAVQSSDQKLIVAGFSYDTVNNQYVFAVARYINDGLTDGSLDGGFGTGGIVTTKIGGVDDRAFAVAIQSTGEIVVAGYSSEVNGSSIRSRVALVRYDSSGNPDPSFGTNGIVTTLIGAGAGAFGLAVQSSDGNLVVAGYSYNGTQNVFAVARYNVTDGSLDATLNPCPVTPTEPCDGIVTTAIGTINDQAYAVAIQSGGEVVVAGSSYATGNSVLTLARYTTAGSLDTTFNTTGKITTPILTDATAFALAIQTDGKILAAGSAYNNTYAEFVLARYNSTDGKLDTTFGKGGKVDTKITYGAEAFGLAIQSDGKPVAAGYSQDAFKQESFTLVRYGTDGIVDATFPPPPP
jgi:uncharacterized delta-60 repeat protein